MSGQYRFYRFCYRVAWIFIRPFHRLDVSGRENIPEGGLIVCANHSSSLDPFLIAFALGIGTHPHFMAKVELFRIPVLAFILRKIGMFSVNRGAGDVRAIRTALKYLKTGEKVAIFPEGTRVSNDEDVAAKTGAVKLAERAGAPILPVYIPRRKHLIGRLRVIIGKPYYVNANNEKLALTEYLRISDELMERIRTLPE